MSGLFRREVMEARRAQWMGAVSVAQPIPVWWFSLGAVLAAALVVVFLIFGEYTRRTRVVGQLVPSAGLITVPAPRFGVLAELPVAEGDRIQAGTPLALLEVPTASTAAESTVEAVTNRIARRAEAVSGSYAAQLAQLHARAEGLAQQASSVEGELLGIQREQQIRQAQWELAQQTLDRYRQLGKEHFVSPIQIQQAESQLLESAAQVQALRRSEASLRRELLRVRQEHAAIPQQENALLAAMERDDASLDQESLEAMARGDAVVTAPVAGTISARLGLPGQVVQAGQPILSVLPEGSQLEAHLMVPSRAIGFLEPGDRVLLRYEAFPYQKFGQGEGRVMRISRSALSSAELASLAVAGAVSEPMYRVIVSLDKQHVQAFGRNELLRPGMALEADVLGEHRQLWEWVLEPLYSVSGRI